jgi:general secretion pathway protein D
MLRRSVTSGARRRMALLRSCCATVALALLFSAPERNTLGQSPSLGGPANAEADQAATPKLPPPASPAAINQPAIPAPTQLPPAPAAPVESTATHSSKATDPKASKPTEDLAAALEHTGELNLHGVSLDKALFMIGEQWNINIVAGDVKGTVNGTFKQAPLREILDAILLSNGYNYRAVGKSLVVSSIEQLGQINPFFQSAIIPVQTADIDEVVTGAQLLKTPKGEVRPIKSAKSIVVLDFPDRVKMIREFVATIDNAGTGRFATAESRNGMALEVLTYRTQYISAKSAEQTLQAVMSKAGRATVLEKEDRLLVTDYSDNLEMVEKVLKSIDRPRPQVRITALLYDISLQDIENLGINWNQAIHGHPDATGKAQSVIGIDSVTQVPFQAGAAGSALTFMNLSKHFDITAVVEALQQANDARLLADPNVAVLENEEAIFEKVQEIPYQQLTQTQQGGSIGTTAFKNVGIELHVTPKIASEGIIRMTVNPKVSRLVGFTPGDNQPIVDTSSAATVLTIANRQTVVIGGLRQRDDVGKNNGIPYLKDLNVIGRLFRSRDLNVQESELVVFISPEIISYSDDPTCRQKIAAETIRCRLEQVPEAEGCPPCCRRLPIGATEGMLPDPSQPVGPAGSGPTPAGVEQELPPLNAQPKPNDGAAASQPYSLEPLSAVRISAAERQLADAGRNEQTRDLVTDGRLRRLPVVAPIETRLVVAPTVGAGIFAAPPAVVPSATPIDSNQSRAAERDANDSIWR